MPAEPAVGTGGSNLFSLGANFHSQGSSTRTVLDRAMILDAAGNSQCETMINQRDEVTNEFAYCNATPAIGTDLATLLTKFGDVHGGYVVTQLAINFKAGEYATVSVTGHQHAANTHAAGTPVGYADVSAAVPASAGFGVPTFAGMTDGTLATGASATLTFSMQHVDVLSATGGHFVGKNLTPTAELTYQWEGTPTTPQPATGWTTDSYGGDDSNAEFDKYEMTAHRYFDLAT